MRDEVGLRCTSAAAVGISTRGRDTGDAQIFINLVDNPRLDHDYTVFARVCGDGMTVVDRIQEGDRMARVEVRPFATDCHAETRSRYRTAGSSMRIRPAVASISTCDTFGNRELRHAMADHRPLPRRHLQWLDVVGEDLLEVSDAESFARLALAARARRRSRACLSSTPASFSVRHHPIDPVDILADVLDEQDRAVRSRARYGEPMIAVSTVRLPPRMRPRAVPA